MMHAEDPGQIEPGGYELFTPIQAINQYLFQSPQDRKGGHFKAQIGQQRTSLSLADTIQQGLAQLMIAGGFEAYLEGVVFDDYSFVGSPMLRQVLVGYNNLIH
jgi:hypothetical protein